MLSRPHSRLRPRTASTAAPAIGAFLVAGLLVARPAGAQDSTTAPSGPPTATPTDTDTSGAPRPAAGAGDEQECFGFSFGSWDPPLDWQRAGHPPTAKLVPLSRSGPRAGSPSRPAADPSAPPPARESAVRELPATGAATTGPHGTRVGSSSGGAVLTLFPAWWPVGVTVELPRETAAGDTVRGIATALVADGRITPPTATVLAWRVACARRHASR